MAKEGIKAFDTTVQETNHILNDIGDEMGDPRPSVAYHALRGVLFALRDRLPMSEAVQFAAQLPMLVRGIFFEGYRPTGKPDKFDKDTFLARVSEELRMGGGANAADAARAVFAVLQRRVDRGEIDDVRNSLPGDIRKLWPERMSV